MSSEFLSRGEIYVGLQAQQMGLIDEVGSQADAIASAAEVAKLRRYNVVDRTPTFLDDPSLILDELEVGSTAATVIALPEHLPPGFFYRYVEPPQ